ncbi:hypothetical protein LTR04_003484, partial [Oleoguttula sp. CCFEE 6159]
WNGPGARQSLRMQLMGPGRELPQVSQDSGFGDGHDSGNHTRGHPSRQGSLNTTPSPNNSSIAVHGNTGGSRLSLVPETQSIDVEAAIAILQELRKKASPEDLVALHKALLPTKEVDHIVSPTAPDIDEFMDHNSAAVSRRRSMLVPGLATRGGPDNDVLRKPIPPMPLSSPRTDSQRPCSDQSMWTNNIASVSPLTHLAALDLANDRRHLFEERASTPSDINYSHIGALRLGSLHITNGAASPEPSTILELTQAKPISDIQAEEGYYTASEGRSSDDNASQNEETFLTVRERILRAARANKANSANVTPERALSSVSGNTQTRQDPSPLRIEKQRYSSDEENIVPPRSASRPRSQPRARASSLAKNYIQECELTTGPHSGQSSLSRKSPQSSPSTSIPAVDRRNWVREEALRKLNGGHLSPQPRTAGSESSSAYTEDTTSEEGSVNRRIRIAKSDSGYSSEASLQAMWNKSKSCGSPQSKETISRFSDVGQRYELPDNNSVPEERLDLLTFEQMLATPSKPEAVSPASELLTFDQIIASSPKSEGASRSSKEEPRVKSKPSRFQILRHKSSKSQGCLPTTAALSAMHSSESIPTITSAQSVPASTSSSPASAKLPTKQKRLQKKRSNSAQLRPAPLTAQSVDNVKESSIPSVPENVASNYSERLKANPDMGHLEHTYKSVTRTRSQETLASSASIFNIEIKFPSPTPESEEFGSVSTLKKRSKSKSRSRSRNAAPDASRRSQSKSRSIFRSRSRSRKRAGGEDHGDDDGAFNIADFGTVAESLGSSPYDAAMSPKPEFTSIPALQVAKHPYQVSTAGIKQRSTGMNEEDAVQYARMRSRDREQDAQLPRVDGSPRRTSFSRPHSFHEKDFHNPRPRNVNRPRSFHEQDLRQQRGRSPAPAGYAAVSRPMSLYDQSVPPVPALPGSHDKSVVLYTTERFELEGSSPPSAKDDVSVGAQELEQSPATAPATPSAAGPTAEEGPQHAVWPGWETQARLWRERRSSASTSLQHQPSIPVLAPPHPSTSRSPSPPKSPSIVVSRYVTPSAVELAMHLEDHQPRKLSGEQRCTSPSDAGTFCTLDEDVAVAAAAPVYEPYRSPPVQAVSAFSSPTRPPRPHLRAAKSDLPRTHHHPASSTTNTTTASAAHSTKSAPSPHRPASTSPRHSIFDLPCPASLGPQHPRSRSSSPAKQSPGHAVIDRYSGGLEYEWERGAGLGGSAGTRGCDSVAKRKSLHLSEGWGLDLSDVPVFRQK